MTESPLPESAGFDVAGDAARIEVDIQRAVAGGVVLGRDDSGRVVLVHGALPGERVRVALDEDGPRLGRGSLTAVLEASPDRVEPPCGFVALGCGGCDLQHATPARQIAMKVEVVADALHRQAHRDDLDVEAVSLPPAEARRTTLRLAVDSDGALGHRRRRSHEVVSTPACLVAHPLLAPVLAEGRFPGAQEVWLRASAADGEVLVVVDRSVGAAQVPEGVQLAGADELARGKRVWLHEEVAGHRLRVSGRAFFQPSPAAAAALGEAVARALGPFDAERDELADLYGGVGLFTVLLGARRSVVVERSRTASADARRNTGVLGAEVVQVAVGRWRPSPADAVVADPPRQGLGREGVAVVAATGASRVALVSCDPAAMGRDVALLADVGYRARGVVVVDQFPNTHHIETVVGFTREAQAS